jgi:FKBP-type peptidyl-prolyl cis-trans isomerase FkpA
MKYNMFKLGIYTFAVAALLAGCKGNGFETDAATGVQYKFFKHADNGQKPSLGDIVNVKMVFKNDKDSVINNSQKNGDSTGTFRVPLNKTFNGCLEQGITLMYIGDSAEFKVSTDSLFAKMSRDPHAKMPPFLHPGTFLTFNITLVKIQTQKDANAEREQMMEKYKAEMMERKGKEAGDIAKFLSDNKYTAKPTKDSLFFLVRSGKAGKAVKEGDSIYVKYTLYQLDGTVLETSDHGPGHNAYPVVYSKTMSVIPGWIEALGMMHDGEKVKVLIPSAIAYGARGNRGIAPFTPLVFDLEITRLVSPKK